MAYVDPYSLHFQGMTGDELRYALGRYQREARYLRRRRWIAAARLWGLGLGAWSVILGIALLGLRALWFVLGDHSAFFTLVAVPLSIGYLLRCAKDRSLTAFFERLTTEARAAREDYETVRDAMQYARELLPTADHRNA